MDISRSGIYDGAGDDGEHVFRPSDNRLQGNDSYNYSRERVYTERENQPYMRTFQQPADNHKFYGVSIYTGKQSHDNLGKTEPVTYGSGNYSKTINYSRDRTIDETIYTRSIDKTITNGAISQNDMDYRRIDRPEEYDAYEETAATPQWANMMLKPNITDNYLKQKWPRISLRALQYRPSDPLAVQDGDILLTNKDKKNRADTTRKTIYCIAVGILFVILATAPTIVLISMATDDTQQDSTELYAVNMELSVDQNFTSDHNDTGSTIYQSFSRNFCSEIDKVYGNTSTGIGGGYKGCTVTQLREGSIIVVFTLYITGVNQAQANNSDVILISSLQNNTFYLGTFVVIIGTVRIQNLLKVQTIPSTTTVTSVSTDTITTTLPPTTVTTETTTTETNTTVAADTTTEANVSTTEADLTTIADTTTTVADTTATVPDTTATVPVTTTTIPDTTTTVPDTTTTVPDTTTVADTTTTVADTTTTVAYTTTTVPDKATTVPDTTTTVADTPTTLPDTTATVPDTTTTVPDTTTTVADTTTTLPDTTTTVPDTTTTLPDTTTTVADTPTTLPDTTTTVPDTTTTVPDTTTTVADTTTTLPDTTTTAHATITVAKTTTTVPATTTEVVTTTTVPDTTTPVPDTTTTVLATTTAAETITTVPATTTEVVTTTTVPDTTTTVLNAITTVPDTTTTVPDTTTAVANSTMTVPDTTTTVPETPTTVVDTTTAVPDTTTAVPDTTTVAETTTTVPATTTVAETTTTVPDTTMTVPDTTTTDPDTTTTVADTTTTVPATTVAETTTTVPAPTTVDETTTTAPASTTEVVTTTTVPDATTTLPDTTTTVPDTTTTVPDTTTTVTYTTTTDPDTTTTVADTTTTVADTTTTTVPDTTTTVPDTTTTMADTTTAIPDTTTTALDTTTTADITTSYSTLTTTAQQAVNCPDATFIIGNSAIYNCTISGRDFREISISNLARTPSKLASIDVNGTVMYEGQAPFTVTYVPDEKVELTFPVVACSDEGTYEVTVTRDSGITKSTGQIAVQRAPTTPTLSMHEDQVIDLQFYRLGSENECVAEVGYPAGYIVIEVRNNQSSTYDELPALDIAFVDNTTVAGNCSNRQALKFGMNYTSDMDGGKIRCRVESTVVSETVSTEQNLLLIPREICACNTANAGVKRGHPKRCDVYVECRVRDYPAGFFCPSSQCRNSVTGECSSNCSDIVCNEGVPQDFCTTLPPSTTTPAPSLYISCNETMNVLIYTETVSVICMLNQTSSFNFINVTKVSSNEEDLATISQNGNVQLLTDDNNIEVSYVSSVIKVTFKNISCLDAATYRFSLQIGGDIGVAQTTVSVLQKPIIPATLTLNADQIADLGSYRNWLLHSCVADIGYPAGTLSIEILNEGESKFTEWSLPEDTTVTDTKANCMVNRKIDFGILFTSAMNGAIIRCVVKNDNFDEPFVSYSQNETASLIPSDFCKDNTEGQTFHQHPEDCTKFVQCEGTDTYGKRCPANTCFGIESVDSCGHCTIVICKLETTTEPETTQMLTTTTPDKTVNTQIDISCNETMNVLIYTETVSVICMLNQTSSFNFINVTKVSSNKEDLATISQNGDVQLLTVDNNIEVTYDSSVIKVTFKNISCLDEAAYRFSLQVGGEIGVAQTTVSVLQKPTVPATLTLNADQIADLGSYRNWLLHSCVADIGYPAGTLSIEILNEGESEFTEWSLPEDTIVTDTKANCMVNWKIDFGILFTSAMNGAIIRCVVKNDNFDQPFVSYSQNETASLIPSDFCKDNTEGQTFHQHPEDCTKFVQCEGTATYGKPCPANTCFGIESVNSCGHCTIVTCKLETTTEADTTTTETLTTTTPETLTTTTPDKTINTQIAMNCTKNSNFIGNGPSNITCTFTTSSNVVGVNITRTVSSGSSVLGTVNNAGILNNESPNGMQLQYTKADTVAIAIEISVMSCADQGTYDFVATTQDNVTYNGQEKLIAKVKPSVPTLELNHQTIVDTLGSHSICKGNVGNPAGSMEVQVKGPNEANFTTFQNFQTTNVETDLECNTEIEHKFQYTFSSGWNNSKIRCNVKNDETIEANEEYISNEDTLILIPDNYCDGVTGYSKHTRGDCAYYIECVNDVIHSKKCHPSTLCFNGNVSYCDHCTNVNSATCNFT